jgi:hypothetical protein
MFVDSSANKNLAEDEQGEVQQTRRRLVKTEARMVS